jgi:hypothetical protein
MKLRKPSTVVAVAAAVVVFSAGGAYAYWTVTGAGQGTATIATVKPLEIRQTEVKGLVLGRSVELKGKITNPNDFEASLLGTHITLKASVDKPHLGCSLENFAILTPSTKATSILANGEVSFEGGSITLLNTRNDQAACQGATITLDYLLK